MYMVTFLLGFFVSCSENIVLLSPEKSTGKAKTLYTLGIRRSNSKIVFAIHPNPYYFQNVPTFSHRQTNIRSELSVAAFRGATML